MTSSRLRDRRSGEDPSVTQQCPQNAGSSAGQGDDGLGVLAALATFLEVEVPVRSFADDAGLRGHVEHPPETAAVALGTVQVAGADSGVTRDGRQPRRRGQIVGVHVAGQVARGDDELGVEYPAHAGQRLDDLGLRVAAERLVDLLVDPLETGPSARIWLARPATIWAAMSSPGNAVCWAWTASRAVAATMSGPRTLRSPSQAVSRTRPRRRIAADVW